MNNNFFGGGILLWKNRKNNAFLSKVSPAKRNGILEGQTGDDFSCAFYQFRLKYSLIK